MSTNFEEVIDYLYANLPVFQNKGKEAFHYKLDRTLALCEALGNPQTKFKSIHIAGTNGKGSTSHFIASILQEQGYKVGLYTSPHLKSFTERIKINGREIPEEEVIQFVNTLKKLFNKISPSFFEVTVAMAFDYFARQKVDYAVIEVGMGGRMDSTNVISPLISVITNISLDHTQYLGNTLTLIAGEKAGIIKSQTPVVIGRKQPNIHHVYENKAKECETTLTYASELISHSTISGGLLGSYQLENETTAIATIKTLSLGIYDEKIEQGLKHVVKNTNLKGRWQILKHQPLLIADTAHNVDGIDTNLKQLTNLSKKQQRFVLGFVSDKDVEGILSLFPKDAIYYFCEPEIQRALSLDEILKIAQKVGIIGIGIKKVNEAIQKAIKDSSDKDVIYVGGSTFVVSEIEGL